MPDIDSEELDDAAEDPPVKPFVGALIGLLGLAAGVLVTIAGVLNLVGWASISLGATLAFAGFVVFVGSMLAWDPDVDPR